MIRAGTDRNAHLASAWTTGIVLFCLGVGLHGAMSPLTPAASGPSAATSLPDDDILIEEFDPPPSPATDVVAPSSEVMEENAEIEIPPLPEIVAPLNPPEMAELTPLEPLVETRKPPATKPSEPKTRTVTRAPSTTKTAPSSQAGASAGTGSPQLFTGGGRGRFPSPHYPASARSARLQGSVRLLVTVESNGTPGSVTITTSSGHTSLDNAARDTILRRWRWPSGQTRRYIVPIRFVLQ